MNNYNVLLKYSLKPKIFGKKQIISFALLFALPFLLITIGGYFAANFIEQEGGLFNSSIADNMYLYPDNQVTQTLATVFPEAKIVNSEAEAKQLFENEKDDNLLIDTLDNQVTTNFNLTLTDEYTINSAIASSKTSAVIAQAPPEIQAQFATVNTPIEFNNIEEEDNDNTDILNTIGVINTVLIYFVILFGFQLLGNEIFEEKNSRAMEIIITNTKPQVHMLAKISATLIFLAAIIVSVGLGVVAGVFALGQISPDIVGMAIDEVVKLFKTLNFEINSEFIIFIIFTILTGFLTVLLFQIVGAVSAAMTTSYEDYQKANGPLVILLLVPYLISIFDIPALSKVLVYIPFFTPFFAPKLYLAQDITLLVFGLCIAIQMIFVVVLYKVCSPVYREGLLNYSTSKMTDIIKRSYQK